MDKKVKSNTKLRTVFLRSIILVAVVCSTFSAVEAQKRRSSAPAVRIGTPVILIHGIGGSDLRKVVKKGETVPKGLLRNGFPNDVLKSWLGDPQNLEFDENGEPRQDTISKDITATRFYDVPGSNDITNLSKFLDSSGYTKTLNLFEFYYDFRYSVPYTASLLTQFIEGAKSKSKSAKVDIVAHSMGGLVARQYLIDNSEGSQNIRRLIFVATPHLGAPKALKALRYGDDLGVSIVDECKLKRAVHNMPGMFNLLPGRRYFEVSGGGYFEDANDLDFDNFRGVLNFDQTIVNLNTGRESRCLLKRDVDAKPFDTLSASITDRHLVQFRASQDAWRKVDGVEVISIVGYGKPTLTAISETAEEVTYTYNTAGDATVPIWSSDAVDDDKTFYVDLTKIDAEHSTLIGDTQITAFIRDLLMKNGPPPAINGISESAPDSQKFVLRSVIKAAKVATKKSVRRVKTRGK